MVGFYRLCVLWPGGRDAAVYGRQDAGRYKALR